jgi:hypothetical protein
MLAGVPYAQDEDGRGLHFVTHLVSAHEDAADLAWVVLVDLGGRARMARKGETYGADADTLVAG